MERTVALCLAFLLGVLTSLGIEKVRGVVEGR